MAALTGRRTFIANGRKTTFVPTGGMRFRGRGARAYLENPKLWAGPPSQAARIFVGLNVGEDPVWSINDVVEVVMAERAPEQGATFVAQRGVFKHADGRLVDEGSVQVILFNLDDSVLGDEFEEQMVHLGTRLAQVLDQEYVIVEMQSAGKVEKIMGVGP